MSVYQRVNRVLLCFTSIPLLFLDVVDDKHQGLEWNVANIRFNANARRFFVNWINMDKLMNIEKWISINIININLN